MAKKPTDDANTTTPAVALAVYEVLVPSVKIGGVIAYRTARVNLTKEQAEALNKNQPDTVRFLGI
jgi:hypothetical protein